MNEQGWRAEEEQAVALATYLNDLEQRLRKAEEERDAAKEATEEISRQREQVEQFYSTERVNHNSTRALWRRDRSRAGIEEADKRAQDFLFQAADAKHALDAAQERIKTLEDAYYKLAAALSRIDYLCGEPNEMGVSNYDVFPHEDGVVERVEKALQQRSRQND